MRAMSVFLKDLLRAIAQRTDVLGDYSCRVVAPGRA
jgi:hypothetical protein